MITLLVILGIVLLVGAAVAAVLGVTSLPAGGIMFAMPYVLFGAAVCLAALGVVCLWLARVLQKEPPAGGPRVAPRRGTASSDPGPTAP